MIFRGKIIFVLALCAMLGAGSVSADFTPQYETFTLKNGLRVVLVESHQDPMVVFRMVFLSGSGADPDSLHGLATITNDMIMTGTAGYPGDRLAAVIDSVGGIMESRAQRDVLTVEGDFLARDLKLALSCLADMCIAPEFEPEVLTAVSKHSISYTFQLEAATSDRLLASPYGTIYGANGYGAAPSGTRQGIRRITIDDVKAYHNDIMRPNNAVLVLAGDIDPTVTKKTITGLFSPWKQGKKITPPHITTTIADSIRVFLIDRPNMPTADFIIGRAAVPPNDESFAALILLHYLLGGGGEVSRLNRDLIRDNELATSIFSNVDLSRYGGAFYIMGSTPVETATDAVSRIFEIMEEFQEIRIPMRELNDAKRFYRGFLPSYYETYASTVSQFATLAGLNVDYDFYESLSENIGNVDPQTLRQTALEYLDRDKMFIIVAGPESYLRGNLSELGTVEVERRGTD